MQEFGSNYESEVLRVSKKLALADVLVFVYDSSDTNSFSYISNLRVSFLLWRRGGGRLTTFLRKQQYKLDDVPSIFVATKSDLDLAQQACRSPSPAISATNLETQRHEVQPEVYCRKLSIRVPLAVSMKTGQTADLFHTITSIAIHPNSSIPGGPDRPSNRLGTYLSFVAALGGVTAVAFVLWRNLGRPPVSSWFVLGPRT